MHHPRELAALQQLAALAAAAGDFVLRRADRLLRAARRFDGHQVAIARRRDEAEDAVALIELDQDDAAAGPGQEVHLVGLGQHGARLARRGDQDLLAGRARDADELGALRARAVAAAGAGARLDERLEAEAQAVAVARDRNGVDRRRDPFLPRRDVADRRADRG